MGVKEQTETFVVVYHVIFVAIVGVRLGVRLCEVRGNGIFPGGELGQESEKDFLGKRGRGDVHAVDGLLNVRFDAAESCQVDEARK